MAWPADYVFAGAVVNYSANVNREGFFEGAARLAVYRSTFVSRFGAVKASAGAHYGVLRSSSNADAGSIAFSLKVAGDMASINDIRSTMDAAVRGAGFTLMASQVYFTSNPRRDGTKQPTVGTPGADPATTVKPGGAGGFGTKSVVPESGIAQFWGDTFFKGDVSLFGVAIPKVLLLAGAGAAILIFKSK